MIESTSLSNNYTNYLINKSNDLNDIYVSKNCFKKKNNKITKIKILHDEIFNQNKNNRQLKIYNLRKNKYLLSLFNDDKIFLEKLNSININEIIINKINDFNNDIIKINRSILLLKNINNIEPWKKHNEKLIIKKNNKYIKKCILEIMMGYRKGPWIYISLKECINNKNYQFKIDDETEFLFNNKNSIIPKPILIPSNNIYESIRLISNWLKDEYIYL